MYEFLAPWGALAPAVCAVAIFLIINEKRRKQMLSFFDQPEGPLVPLGWTKDISNLA